MVRPAFQCVWLQDGSAVVVKTEMVRQVSEKDARRYENAALSFNKNLWRYLKKDRNVRIAGILFDFDADEFTREDVLVWCAFGGVDFTLENISSALSGLQKGDKPLIESVQKGPNARWQVRRENLRSFINSL